jgi:hypothetical protein
MALENLTHIDELDYGVCMNDDFAAGESRTLAGYQPNHNITGS